MLRKLGGGVFVLEFWGLRVLDLRFRGLRFRDTLAKGA